MAYNIRRSPRRKKTVAVTVGPDGDVLIVAPPHHLHRRTRRDREPESRVDRTPAPEHGGARDPALSAREFVSGESIVYLGRHYRLKVHPKEGGEAKLRGGWLHVCAPAEPQQRAQTREAVIAWFRRHASERLPERVEAWRSKVGVPMPPVIVSDQQKRWGSCDRKRHHPPQLAHHPGPHAPSRLRGRPRTRAPSAPGS